MMNCPPGGPHPRVLHQEGTLEVAQGPNCEGSTHTGLSSMMPSVALRARLGSRLSGAELTASSPKNALVLPDGMMPPMPPMHPTFGVGPTFYVQLITLIRGPDDMFSSPLRQHILNYEPP